MKQSTSMIVYLKESPCLSLKGLSLISTCRCLKTRQTMLWRRDGASPLTYLYSNKLIKHNQDDKVDFGLMVSNITAVRIAKGFYNYQIIKIKILHLLIEESLQSRISGLVPFRSDIFKKRGLLICCKGLLLNVLFSPPFCPCLTAFLASHPADQR